MTAPLSCETLRETYVEFTTSFNNNSQHPLNLSRQEQVKTSLVQIGTSAIRPRWEQINVAVGVFYLLHIGLYYRTVNVVKCGGSVGYMN